MRRKVSAALAALAAVTIGLGSGSAASAVTPTATETRGGHMAYNVVQLGDSYSAGNGAGAYYGDPQARRSHNNYAEKYAGWLATQPNMYVRYTSYAHSGNTTTEVLRDQIPQVPTDTDLVLLTIGGNDVNFSDIVRYCFVVGSRSSSDCREKVDAANRALSSVRTKTEAILQSLTDRLGTDAEIILVGYPLLSTREEFSLCDYTFLCWGRYAYNASAAVRDLGHAANRMQLDLVASWNQRPNVARLLHASAVAAAFEGREPEPRVGVTNAYRWVNEFWETEGVQNPGQDTSASFSSDKLNWYHPNITGHAQVAQVIIRDIGLPPYARHVQAVNRNRSVGFAESGLTASGPNAWLHGPWVQQVGTSLTLDARGSLADGSEIVQYEWDVDGDGAFDVVTAEPTYDHEFSALFDGEVVVRVTQVDGRTATASTHVQITEDGDSTTAALDNCPALDNDSQSDEDGDGVGDECDPTPGHATEDRPGVHAVDAAGVLSREGADPSDPAAVPADSEGTAVTLSADAARVGATVQVSASGFVPGDTLDVWLHSTPVLVGSATVGADGTATVTAAVPVGTEVGAHRLYAVAPAMLASAPLTVLAPEPVPRGGGASGNAGGSDLGGSSGGGAASAADPAAKTKEAKAKGATSLANSGAETPAWLLPTGLLVALAGVVLLARRRRGCF